VKNLLNNWRKFSNTHSITEEFYLTSDTEYSNPLSQKLVSSLADRLPGGRSKTSSEPLKASGAEGIVLSLDDKRVIKLFHSIDNAAKNLPLVSKDMPETAQVYSVGKIVLDQPVIYYKKGSSYTPTDVSETKEVYYIVMQRVVPDPHIYNYIEIAYDKYNRISSLDLVSLIQLYNMGDPSIQDRANQIFSDFIANINNTTSLNYNTIEEFVANATKKQKNIARQQFSIYRKNKTKEFVLVDGQRPVSLKKMILNYLGIENDIPYAKQFLEFLSQTPIFHKRPKKSFTDNNLAQDLSSIIELVKKIRIDKKTAWNDIHRDQFGRDLKNNLVALDLGVKGDSEPQAAAAAFNKNVSKLSTRGSEIKQVKEIVDTTAEVDDIRTINVFDFDKTLFWTHEAESGKKKYEDVFGEKYPHKGWFGREESLRDELEIQANNIMKSIYNTLRQEPASINVLISNRTYKLHQRLQQFLSDRGYEFDEILLKKGTSLKTDRLQQVWEKHQGVDKINVFDDLPDAIEQYRQLKELYSIYRDDLKFNIFQVGPDDIVEV